MLAACSQSCLFWLNAFVWTYRQKETRHDGTETIVTGDRSNVPFISWPIQDEAVEDVYRGIQTGQDINIIKSRDMGATWLILAVTDWMFLFEKNMNAGVVSRKESLVDSRGDMDSLFEKLRYINGMLPPWMVPNIRNRYMHMHNLELNSTIAGESTNTDVGRGGRKTFYFVDEAAAILNAQEIEHSLSQNTPCQIWVSTPKGPGTAFSNRIREKRGMCIRFPWWRHPEKARGAYQVTDELGKIHWTSPWKKVQDIKYSRKTIAQEIEMDEGQAGDMFFDHSEIERHRQDHERPPEFIANLTRGVDMTEEEVRESLQKLDVSKFHLTKGGRKSPWRFWEPLKEDDRPRQDCSYIFGIDISNGAGESNSVITVVCRETGHVVAKWWDSYTSPEALAVVVAIAGVWFGGARGAAFIVWENNGPGGIFGRKIMNMGYPYYYRQRVDGTRRDRKTPKYGWHSTNERKEVMLGMYRDALSRDKYIQHCKESFLEASDYIYDDTGQIIPAVLRDELSGGRALHGDHVIADGLACLGMEELPKQLKATIKYPVGSYAWRKKQHEKRKKNNLY